VVVGPDEREREREREGRIERRREFFVGVDISVSLGSLGRGSCIRILRGGGGGRY